MPYDPAARQFEPGSCVIGERDDEWYEMDEDIPVEADESKSLSLEAQTIIAQLRADIRNLECAVARLDRRRLRAEAALVQLKEGRS